MPAEVDIFDFEGVIADAVAKVFVDGGFTAANALTAQSDPEFQKRRPRAEIVFSLNGSKSPIQYAVIKRTGKTDLLRNAAWIGTLDILALSEADIPGKRIHSQYRAKVRNFTQQLMDKINDGVALPYHKIQQVVEGNTRVSIKLDGGTQTSLLSFVVNFSVHSGAWAQLSN